MVARIKIGNSLSRGFFYNEHKVKEGVAEFILAGNYPISTEKLSEFQRLNVLQKIASLNENAKVNSVHISLNFDPSEQISQELMKEIAGHYMDKIGFGAQPYLVYQHHDAGHPHMHILTTKVGLDGKAIRTHNIGKNQSEIARKELEIQFKLVKAEDMKTADYKLKSAYVQQVNYGKTESKRAIAIVLNEVVKNYKFTSIPELNAVLNQYNVMADRGTEQSRTFKNNGLHYKILDEHGKPIGVPIKASLFANKPTLKFLQEQFKRNDTARNPYKSRIKNAVDFFFLKHSRPSIEQLIKALEKDGIDTVLRKNDSGIIYGFTYVDHRNKCVFNGSALGKEYNAKAIQERCGLQPFEKNDSLKKQGHQLGPSVKNNNIADPHSNSLLDALLLVENTQNSVPYELSGKKKKKRKRKSN